MSTPQQLVDARSTDWEQLDRLLGQRRLDAQDVSTLAELYRAICADLIRARQWSAPPSLVAHLDSLTARAHNRLYGRNRLRARGVWELLYAEFPRVLRRNWRPFLLASLLFVVPLGLTLVGTLVEPELATRVVPRQVLHQSAQSYSSGFEGREASADTQMFGFYIYNNVGIAFRCFATGVLFGLGSAFFLVYNGFVIGAVLGFVIDAGHGHNILTFICGHGPFELTAIVISGAAGMRLGYALLDTGGRTRLGSMRAISGELVTLILGAGAMLVAAALIEGYWSPSGLAAPVKWGVGAAFSALVTAWLALAGRRHEGAPA